MNHNTKENLIALVIVLAIVAVIAYWVYSGMTKDPISPQLENIPLQDAPMKGSVTSRVLVIEFSDFQCSFCGQFARETLPEIQDLVDNGTVAIAFKHFPLDQIHPFAVRAGMAAACAQEQDQFWEYHDVLFANQDALNVGDLQRYAEEIGLDMTLFNSCFLSDATSQIVLRDKQLGLNNGVTGTPTFFFNGRRVTGFLTPEEFRAEVLAET